MAEPSEKSATPKSEKKDSNGFRVFFTILDKLIIAGIIIWLSTTLGSKRDTDLENLKAQNTQLLLDQKSNNRLIEASITQSNKIEIEQIQSENKRLRDSIKSVDDLKNKFSELQQVFVYDLAKLDTQFSLALDFEEDKIDFDKTRDINRDRLQTIKDRLSSFYWPVVTRLEKGQSIAKALKNSILLSEIEQEVLLKNHLEVVSIIENYKHLAYADQYLNKEISYYLGYVGYFQALQAGGFPGDPSDIGSYTYRPEFYEMLIARTNAYQSQYNQFLKSDGKDLIKIETDHESIYRDKGIHFEKSLHIDKQSPPDYCSQIYSITQSRTDESFAATFNDSIAIFLKESVNGESALIEISYYNRINKTTIAQDRDKSLFSKHLNIEDEAAFQFGEPKSYFKVRLNRVFRKKGRLMANFTVHRWGKNTSSCDLKAPEN